MKPNADFLLSETPRAFVEKIASEAAAEMMKDDNPGFRGQAGVRPGGILRGVTPTAEQLRRWLAGFEAAAAADREALRAAGANPAWSIATSLAMIETARRLGGPAGDGTRETEAEAVRLAWRRLRERLLGR